MFYGSRGAHTASTDTTVLTRNPGYSIPTCVVYVLGQATYELVDILCAPRIFTGTTTAVQIDKKERVHNNVMYVHTSGTIIDSHFFDTHCRFFSADIILACTSTVYSIAVAQVAGWESYV